MTDRALDVPATSRRPDASASWILALGSVLCVVLMANHPSAGHGDIASTVARIAGFAGESRAVHGGLIALMIAVFCGYVALGAHLGWSSCVRAATVAYGVGVVSHLGAALFSGFVVSGLAERYTGKLASELAALEPVLVACHETNQALAVTGSLAMSAAIALWSAVLFGRGTFARALAVLGACVGLGTAAALLTGNLRLHVHGMALVVTSQAAWAIGVAIWLARERWRAR